VSRGHTNFTVQFSIAGVLSRKLAFAKKILVARRRLFNSYRFWLTAQGRFGPERQAGASTRPFQILLEFATAVLPLIIVSHYPRHLKDRDSLG